MAKNTVTKVVMGVLLLIILSGCASKEIVYLDKPVEVKVPVYVTNIAIKPINRPELSIKKITEYSSPQEVAEAYYNSLKSMIIYSNKLEKILEPFYLEYEAQNDNKRN